MNTSLCVSNVAEYSVIKSLENVEGFVIEMYGVVGKNGNEVITIKGLSSDATRVDKLVADMNNCGLELCHLRDVVEDFLFESYGFVIV